MVFLWVSISLCSVAIFYDSYYLPASIFQAILNLTINIRFRLSHTSPSIFYFATIFEILLGLLSILFYNISPIYCLIFWIFFSSINKFAVESPLLFNFYGRYSVYLGYSCGALMLGLYSRLNNQIFLRYGSLWILINMSAICYAMVFRNGNQIFYKEKFAVCLMVCICSAYSIIDNSLAIVLPSAFISTGFFLYDSYVFFNRLIRFHNYS